MVTNIGSLYANDDIAPDKSLENFILNLHIRVLGHGMRNVGDLSVLNDFMTPYFLLVYYVQGSTRIKHGEDTFDIKPGTMFIFKPYELYSGTRLSQEDLVYKFIYFDITPISSRSIFDRQLSFTENQFTANPWYSKIGSTLNMISQINANNDEQGHTFLLQYSVRGIVAFIMYERMQETHNAKNLLPKKETTLVDQSFAYLSRHMSEPINITKLARSLGTSRSNLDRIFMDIMLTTPIKAMTRYKIQESLELLRNGATIKKVSKELGYSSPFHFSKTFKSVLGKSPNKYLK